jgi:phage FluMu protein Com
MKKRVWKCDFKECDETAQWYRIWNGLPFKLCTHHYAELGRKRLGKPIGFSELSADNLDYLEEKDRRTEFKCAKCDFVNLIPALRKLYYGQSIKCEKCGNVLFSLEP